MFDEELFDIVKDSYLCARIKRLETFWKSVKKGVSGGMGTDGICITHISDRRVGFGGVCCFKARWVIVSCLDVF